MHYSITPNAWLPPVFYKHALYFPPPFALLQHIITRSPPPLLPSSTSLSFLCCLLWLLHSKLCHPQLNLNFLSSVSLCDHRLSLLPPSGVRTSNQTQHLHSPFNPCPSRWLFEHPHICLHPSLAHTWMHRHSAEKRSRGVLDSTNHKASSCVGESGRRRSATWRNHGTVNLPGVITAQVFCEFTLAQKKTPRQIFMSLWLPGTSSAKPYSLLQRKAKKGKEKISPSRFQLFEKTVVTSSKEDLVSSLSSIAAFKDSIHPSLQQNCLTQIVRKKLKVSLAYQQLECKDFSLSLLRCILLQDNSDEEPFA